MVSASTFNFEILRAFLSLTNSDLKPHKKGESGKCGFQIWRMWQGLQANGGSHCPNTDNLNAV